MQGSIGESTCFLIMLYLALYYFPVCARTPIALDHINLSPSTSYEFFRKSGFKPRKDMPPWPVVLPVAWDANPFGDRNWRFQLHA